MDKLKLNADQMLDKYRMVGDTFANADQMFRMDSSPDSARDFQIIFMKLCAKHWKRFRVVGWKTQLWDSAIRGAQSFQDHSITYEDIASFLPTVVFFDEPIIDDIFPESARIIGLVYIGAEGFKDDLADLIIIELLLDEEKLPDNLMTKLTVVRRDEKLSGVSLKLYAAEQFAKLEIASKQEIRAHRPTVRRLQRAMGYVPEVSVILLRRHKRDFAKGNEPSSVDWDCQWIVSGHWRKQWYPSEGKHKPVYIAPYIKGPEDKPLKPHAGSLYVVNR